MTDKIRVVAIAFFRLTDKKYLLCRRGPKESGAGSWEFPGGKVDLGETDQQALAREIHEELDVQIDPQKLLYIADHEHQYETKRVHLLLFKYDVQDLEFRLIDHDKAEWATLDQMSEYSLAAADIPFIQKLRLI